jgi:phasin family protein
MSNELIKQWTELNKNAIEAIKELGEINTSTMTRLTQRQMEMVNLYMEGGAKQLQALHDVKGMPDIVATQTQVITEVNEKLMENARQTMEIFADAKAQLSAWAEKGLENTTALFSKSTAVKK